jgi:hypothetical protein
MLVVGQRDERGDTSEADLWEPRVDWPSGELAWFEVARLGLRESPS